MRGRKVLAAAMFVAVFLLTATTPSFAIPVQGLVDPGFGAGYDLGSTLSGMATYTFTNVSGGGDAPFYGLTLALEGDVFNLASTGILSSSLTTGWAVSTLELGTYQFAMLGGTPIPVGSSLNFSINYNLLNNAFSLPWDSGSPWQQSYGVMYTGAPFYSGGYTSVASVPEPSSLLLLGVGLGVILGFKRKGILNS